MTISSRNPLPLGSDGLLTGAEKLAQTLGRSFVVFAQQPDARVDIESWRANAQRFFDADVALSVPKSYGATPPTHDGAHLVLLRRDRLTEERALMLMPRTEGDLSEASSAHGGAGLALLTRRCPTVVRVAVVENDDVTALLLATIIASSVLGPILSVDRTRIFGVRTGRLEVERLSVQRGRA